MAEVVLIGADIQEVIGSAIAIKIRSQWVIPLWGGVLITASHCFIFLFLENYGVRKLEAFFAVLISTMALSFAWMFAETRPSSKELIIGQNQAFTYSAQRQFKRLLELSPHNVFLYSALVQSRKLDPKKKDKV
ncbi:hypothetical protein RDI58_011795 [Solanum bulbocastanum]|uniref:Uncharacterized protein n=1 Tax=Solanum bulbocastanum TaxID=147425 RepID=A0AAN8YGM3_SOLBU